MNKLSVFLCLIIVQQSFGMEIPKDSPNSLKRSQENIVKRAIQVLEGEKNMPNLDALKAHEIAQLYYEGIQMDVTDLLNAAEKNKKTLPTVCQVLMAIQTMQNGDSETPEFKKAQGILIENYFTMNN